MEGTDFEVVETPLAKQTQLQQVFNDHRGEAMKGHSSEFVNEVYQNLGREIQELVNNVNDLPNRLIMVTQFLPFFDRNYLINEGVTDMSRLDETYLTKIGQTLVNDYRQYNGTATGIKTKTNQLKTDFDSLTSTGINEASLTNISNVATELHTELTEWACSFERLISEALRDIINHLNPLRPANRQLTI